LNISGHIHVDVIIVGAGVVGASFAAILKNSGMTCAVIEAESARKKPDMGGLASFDPRTLALTQASKNILQSVGAWNEISEDRLGCFRKMHVWDENGLGEVNFNSDDLCEPIMGYIVEQKIVEAALESVLNRSDHVSLFRPASAKLLDTDKDKICIELDDGRQLSAKLLVAADGQSSTVRRLACINFKIHDYHQDALACVVETERPHQQVARQRFLSRGPLAFLPMAHPNQCGIVWSTTAEQAAELKALDEKAFNKTLAEAFAYKAGEIVAAGPRATFPLARAQAEEYCRPRLALVGDAAHRIHPLAGHRERQRRWCTLCLA
jgi:2-octaprenylphenol hydroxylase